MAKKISGSFLVDTEHMHLLGVVDPYSMKSIEIFKSGKLSSNERLYFSLWGSKALNAVSFKARQRIISAGEDVHNAFFIVSGSLLGVEGEKIYRLGPGSVIGLAEGMVNRPIQMTVVCVTSVQVKLIPLHKVDAIIPKLPEAAKGFFKTVIQRVVAT